MSAVCSRLWRPSGTDDLFTYERLGAFAPPQDLESRKRAPLYNKKQEEETKAALDAAAEARAAAAEAAAALKAAEVQPRPTGWKGPALRVEPAPTVCFDGNNFLDARVSCCPWHCG